MHYDNIAKPTIILVLEMMKTEFCNNILYCAKHTHYNHSFDRALGGM